MLKSSGECCLFRHLGSCAHSEGIVMEFQDCLRYLYDYQRENYVGVVIKINEQYHFHFAQKYQGKAETPKLKNESLPDLEQEVLDWYAQTISANS